MTARPDIVFLVLDTQRADRLSCYGCPEVTSPHLDAFAADAALFRYAFAPAQWTIPVHASLFTGMYPTRHGAHFAGGWLPGRSRDGRAMVAYPLPASAVTMAEALRDRGYRAGGFVANFSYLYRDFGVAQGFGWYDDAPGLLLRLRPAVLRLAQQARPTFCLVPFRSARDINAAALAWLDANLGGIHLGQVPLGLNHGLAYRLHGATRQRIRARGAQFTQLAG